MLILQTSMFSFRMLLINQIKMFYKLRLHMQCFTTKEQIFRFEDMKNFRMTLFGVCKNDHTLEYLVFSFLIISVPKKCS